MAETETLGRVETSKEAEASKEKETIGERALLLKVMRSPNRGAVGQRIFYLTVFMLTLWLALSIAASLLKDLV